jgi:N-acetyl-gamma-glutamyl-phosphate reductase
MKVGIIGASGYTGGELLRILARHEECEISCATSRRFRGKIQRVHPHLRGALEIEFEDLRAEEVADKSDFVFTATPHGASMKIVPELLDMGVKVVDLSGDFRFSDVSTYEKYYGLKHEHPGVRAVYGLPELHRQEIRKAKLVANPGCYPTSVILGLAPIIKEGLIEVDRIAVDSKSGISGAGATPKEKTHYPVTADSVLPYSVSAHRHLPEMEQELRVLDGNTRLSFVPHLVPVIRGISSTMHCFLIKDVEGEDIGEVYSRFYRGEPFVRVLEKGEMPRMSSVRGSNYCDIGCFEVDKERRRTVIVSTIDNLVKGASGQAVQNMNIMAGYEETAGLKNIGIHP